jgi:hypothetical protein
MLPRGRVDLVAPQKKSRPTAAVQASALAMGSVGGYEAGRRRGGSVGGSDYIRDAGRCTYPLSAIQPAKTSLCAWSLESRPS